ncbi:MAG: hypothetical protein ACRDT8_20815 [Micromonosporaceae bacterium]
MTKNQPDTQPSEPRDSAAEARRGTHPGERRPGHVPEGTATDEPPLEGSSLDAPPVQGVYRPDVGPGGAEIDEGDRPLPSRRRAARGPGSSASSD